MAPRRLRFLDDPRAKRNAFVVGLWLAMVVGLYLVREILLPFVVAVALAYVIDPAVTFLSSRAIRGRRVPRWGGVVGLYAGFAAVTWLLVSFFVPQVYRELVGVAQDASAFVRDLNEGQLFVYAEDLEDLSRRMRLPVRIETQLEPGVPVAPSDDVPEEVDAVSGFPVVDDPARPAVPRPLPRAAFPEDVDEALFTINLARVSQEAGQAITSIVRSQTADIVGQLQKLVGGTVRFVFQFFLVLMITAFLSMSVERIKVFAFTVVPVEDQAKFDAFLERLDRGLSGVVRGQLTICFVNGLLTLVGLLLLKVKFAFLLATLAMVFSLIPIFGSILSTIPIVIVGLASSFTTALLAVLWIVGIHFLEANFLNPKIMGDAAKIHPALVVLALVAGEHFYGLAGALFAVPVMSMLVTVARSVIGRVKGYEADLSALKAERAPRPAPRRGPRIWREPSA